MTWINNFQVWLSESQSLQNAQKVVDYLYTDDKDWSKESISALIGNMRHESSINPNMYEYGYGWSADRGFGLVQWTPRSKFWDWGKGKGFSETQLRSGDAQLARIDYEVENNIQWIAKDSVFNRLTFKEFRTNSRELSVNDLTEAFTWGYERPNRQAGENSMPARKAFANRAFNELDWSGIVNPDPDPVPDPPDEQPNDDPEGIDIAGFISELNIIIEKMLSADVYKVGNSGYYQNSYLKMMSQMDNMYKIKPNTKFFDAITKKFEEFNDSYIPEPLPDPEPDPDPTEPAEKKFPVKIQGGINFFKRSNWGIGTLQRNMTYGTRSNGVAHYGYDIGGGGVNHQIHSVTNGKVIQSNFVNGIGNRIVIDNDGDEYFLQYGHLDSSLVNVGDSVTVGQVIGIMGKTGGNYAIHLDLKISTTSNGFHSWDTTIDPESYLEIDKDNSTKLPQP